MNNNDKKEIINLIDNLNAISFYELNEHSKECYYEIRNAILAMPIDASQKSCENAISRQATINVFCKNCDTKECPCDTYRMLNKLPSVTPKQKTGHWIVISPTDMYCSECNEIEHLDTSRRFCAYCGCLMVEPQERGK